MQLHQRELLLLNYVARFGQLTSKHIQQLVFTDLSSHTPADRTLRRLVDSRMLARIERRLVGGTKGGSGMYVYQLGPDGHRMYSEERYIPRRAVSYHSLAIADCFVSLKRLERGGSLKIDGYLTEPECHVTIGRHMLKPDLYVELTRPDGSRAVRFMYEIDMGSQNRRQITEKFVRYWQASQAATDEKWPSNQLVLFVAIDEQRVDELKWMLDKGDQEQRALFRILTLPQLEAELS